MLLLTEFARRIRYLVFRDRYTAELEEEMRLHAELRAARFYERGLPLAEARDAARRRFGNATTIQEQSRDMWGWSIAEHAVADLRFALRRIRRRPGFSSAVIVITALGIGATTAVFSAVDAALLRPLPFARPGELYSLTNVMIPFDPGPGFKRPPSRRHMLNFTDVAAMPELFSQTAAFAAGGLNLSDPDHPRRVRVGVVTAGFFETFGARAQQGRTFDAPEGKPDGPRAVILSDALWRDRFGGADMLGKTLTLSGARYTVVGVMGRGFNFPNESDLWIPLTVPTTFETFAPFRGFLSSQVVARAGRGVSGEAASSRLMAAWTQLAGPPTPGRVGPLDEMINRVRRSGAAVPFQRDLVGRARTALVVLMGATALLLLIACANVANLLLSDGVTRGREVALREVLGATRRRITRQLLAESVLLAVAGATLGFALAPALLGVLRAASPADLAGVAPVEVNLRVLAFAGLVAVITGITFGLWPALSATRGDAAPILASGGGHGATAARLGRARRILVTTELSLTVMLLVGAGLLLRSLERLLSQDLGMQLAQVGTLQLSFAGGDTRAGRIARLHAIVDRLEGDPAIEGAAVVNDLPLRAGGGMSLLIQVDGQPKPKDPDETMFARYLMVTGGYFKALGIPLLRGRTFEPSDDSIAPAVAVINSAMARRWWPGVDPIGRTFRFPSDSVPISVVGLVADVREGSLDKPALPQMYFPIDRQTPMNVAVVARSPLPQGALLARLTDAVRAVDPAQAVYDLRTMEAVLAGSVAPRRTNAILIALLGMIALALSVSGVYAVMSYSVSCRAREFGIRAALGATGRDIVSLVGREMAAPVSLGLTIGLAAAWAASRIMTALLFGIGVHDAATYFAVPLVLAVPALLATLVPALRATRVSPAEVMRAD